MLRNVCLQELSLRVTSLTHSHQDALNGAVLQASAVHQALHCAQQEKIDPAGFVDKLSGVMTGLEGK